MSTSFERTPFMSATAPSIARGRPKSIEKRRKIREAAIKLFLDRGFDGASMDEIAERAGVSKQTVYSHFNNKEDLFSACICEKCVSYELSNEFVDLTTPVDEMLRQIGHKFSRLLLSDDAVRVKRLLCASAEQSPQLSEIFYRAGPVHMIGMLTQYLAAQTERGELCIDEPRAAACQLLYMIHGEAHFCRMLNVSSGPDLNTVPRYVDSCVDMFLRAYRAQPAVGDG